MGSILSDQISQLVQGGQIVLQVMFESFAGSGFAAQASSVAISIAAATDGTGQPTPGAGQGTPVGPTSENVTSIDQALYTFVYTADWDQAPGDYLVTWPGVVEGVT